MVLVGDFVTVVTLAHLFVAGPDLCGIHVRQLELRLLIYFVMLVTDIEQLVRLFVLLIANFNMLVTNFEQLWFPAV